MSNIELKYALQNIKEFCLNKDVSISVAESATSGKLQYILGSAEGASFFFEGGITTYNCVQKMEHLLIPYSECNPCYGVSKEIAIQMALGVCELFTTKIGISITGYASPIPEKDIYDLHAFAAIVLNGEIIFAEKISSEEEDPEQVKLDFCLAIIQALKKLFTTNHNEIDNDDKKFSFL